MTPQLSSLSGLLNACLKGPLQPLTPQHLLRPNIWTSQPALLIPFNLLLLFIHQMTASLLCCSLWPTITITITMQAIDDHVQSFSQASTSSLKPSQNLLIYAAAPTPQSFTHRKQCRCAAASQLHKRYLISPLNSLPFPLFHTRWMGVGTRKYIK